MENQTERLYKRFFGIAEGYLEKSELKDAERNFACALRQVYNQEGKLYEIVAALKGLGFVYKERGSVNKSGEDFVKATALFISSLARLQKYSENEERMSNNELTAEIVHLQEEIESVHTMFIDEILGGHQDGKTINDYERVEQYKGTLQEIRQAYRMEIGKLDQLPVFDPGKRDVGVEKERANTTQRMYTEIAKSMKELVTRLVDDCVQVMSSPPCMYSVLGLGSTARELVTPYSDLEFCILVEKDTEEILNYFTNLTNFLHLKVVELGETILPSLGIQSLNDYYSDTGSKDDDWYFDNGRRGFSFDGAMPWASKLPKGRDKTTAKPWVQSLIKTPIDMANLLSHTSISKEGYHLADVLSTSVLICGDQSLYENYNILSKGELLAEREGDSSVHSAASQCADQQSTFDWRQRILQQLIEVERQYHTSLSNYIMQPGGSYTVKNDFYRFPSLIVEYVAMYYNVDSPSSWTKIDQLEIDMHLSPEAAQNFRTALGIAGELRLRAYLDNDSQNECFSDILDLVAKRDAPTALELLLLRYFFTIVPLEEIIRKLSEVSNLQGLKDAVLYDDNPIIKAKMYCQFRQYYKAKEILQDLSAQKLQSSSNKEMDLGLAEVYKILGNTLHSLENGAEAVIYHRVALDISENVYKDNPTFHNLKTVGDSYLNYGADLCAIGQKEKALPYFKKALEVRISLLEQSSTTLEQVACLQDVAGAQLNLSRVYTSSTPDDVSKFFYHNQEALKLCEILMRKYNIFYYYYPSLYLHQGLTYYNLTMFHESVKAYLIGLEFYYKHKNLYTLENESSFLNNLGNAVLELGDLDKARSLHTRAYEIRIQIHGSTDHNSIARSLNNFGLINESTGNLEEAHKFYVQARDMSVRINGENSPFAEHLQMYKRNVNRIAMRLRPTLKHVKTNRPNSRCNIV